MMWVIIVMALIMLFCMVGVMTVLADAMDFNPDWEEEMLTQEELEELANELWERES